MPFQTHLIGPLESRYPVRSAKLFLFAFSFFLFLSVAKGASTLPVITSATSASGKAESSFSYQITATNVPTSYGATGLPTGLRVNTRTGVISGTPTAAGTSRLTLSAANRSGKGTATLTLTISAEPPVITSGTTASGKVGSAFSYHMTATNAPTSYGASGLPAGLSVNSSTGLISGTPTAAATSTVTLSATNSTGTGGATLTLSIAAALPVITSATSASGKVGSAFSYQITATNSPTSYGATGLPAGLTVSSTTGLISGTPTGAATSTVTLSAINSGGTGNVTLTLTIAAALPVITSATSATGTVGTSFSYQITATNTPTSYGATGLPAGLTVSSTTGLISGTPTAAATSTVTLSAVNIGGTGNATLTLSIAAALPVITSATSASGKVGSALSYQITATNAPTSYGATGLPAGLTVSSTTGLISGTPTAAATSTVTLSATNGAGTGNATLTLSIAAALPVITSATSASGIVGTAFSYQITATNTPTSYGAAGLPACLTLSSTTGLISGTPTAAATSTVTLSATNSGGTGSATLTLTIGVGVPSLTSLSPASALVGSGAQTLSLTGTNFLATSTVTYNAVAHAATFVSSTQLAISLSATDVATIGTYPVAATNPGQGGGASNSLSFSVKGAVVSLSTTSLSFGNEALEVTSSSQVVTLNNTGSASLTISSLAFTGADASDFTEADTCGSSVAAGGTCTIAVMFTPAAAGTRTATLSINDNATVNPQSVALSGSGVHDVMLSWAASTTPGILGYYVYRGTAAGGESSTPLNSTPISSTSFTDESVTAGTTYYYLVTAVASNDVTQSPASNEASASVPTP